VQKRMVELNQKWKAGGQEQHLVRIGINTGMVTVGNLGIDRLWDYTVVGSEVNKAQRLEGKCAAGGLYLGTRTCALARNRGVLPHDLKPTSEELKGLGEQGDLYPVTPEVIVELVAKSPFKPNS
jgi:class 3 adenylate cyclase